MKEWAPLVGKSKKSKSEDKFYSDEEDEKEEESHSSDSEGSSSSGSSGTFLRFKTSPYRNADVMRSVGVQNRAARARTRRKAAKFQTSPPVILERVPVPLKGAPASRNLNKR